MGVRQDVLFYLSTDGFLKYYRGYASEVLALRMLKADLKGNISSDDEVNQRISSQIAEAIEELDIVLAKYAKLLSTSEIIGALSQYSRDSQEYRALSMLLGEKERQLSPFNYGKY